MATSDESDLYIDEPHGSKCFESRSATDAKVLYYSVTLCNRPAWQIASDETLCCAAQACQKLIVRIDQPARPWARSVAFPPQNPNAWRGAGFRPQARLGHRRNHSLATEGLPDHDVQAT